MLTYELKKSPGVPLYEALYRAIRADILSGALPEGEKLPSKRALAENLEVSKITVEAAYSQLLAEGYMLESDIKVMNIPHAELVSLASGTHPADFLLPYSTALPAQYLEGRLSDPLKDKKYLKIIL